MATRTFSGYDTLPDGVLIADGTNPWVEVDGVPVDWTTVDLPRVPCSCDEEHDALVDGVIDAIDSPEGIQRCDSAETNLGDLDAALALAKLVGGVVKFETDEHGDDAPARCEDCRTYEPGDLHITGAGRWVCGACD